MIVSCSCYAHPLCVLSCCALPLLSPRHCGIIVTALLFVIIVAVTHECYTMMLDHTNKHRAKTTLAHAPTTRMCQSFWIMFTNKHRSVPDRWNSMNESRLSGGGVTFSLQTIEIPLKYVTAPIRRAVWIKPFTHYSVNSDRGASGQFH